MSKTTENNGRLCNQIFRNLATSFIAEKHNLYVEYSNYNTIRRLGIPLYVGDKIFSETKVVTEENYNDVLEKCEFNINTDSAYFQTGDINNKIFLYLRQDNIKNSIIEHNKYKERYNNNKDIYIHIRLGDAEKWNPGAKYYINAISSIKEREIIYISTDDVNHSIIKEILKKYKNVYLLPGDEINNIQAAITCKYVILSHGSFSALIGYLSYFSVVYYPDFKPAWCPIDLFKNKGFIGLRV
jgi:hypothetical protein